MQPRSGVIVIAFFVAVLVGMAAGGTCPPDTFDGTGDVVLTPSGPLVVESCLSADAGLYTMTYTIHNESRLPVELCKFYVPGYGAFSTVRSAAPPGLELTVEEVGGCSTWWAWTGRTAEILPGAEIVLSFTVDREVTALRRDVQLVLCDGTSATAEAVVPCACAGAADDPLLSCLCGDATPPCEVGVEFVGDGTRIDLLRGPARQTLRVCDPSWVRHGFSGVAQPDESLDFRLEIDGVDVPLEQRVGCRPAGTPGLADGGTLWHVQFSADFFSVGRTYEFTGHWYWRHLDWEQSKTVLVDVILCLTPIPVPPLALLPRVPCPDLVVESLDASCTCGWNQQKEFGCDLVVDVVLKNTGDADADSFVVALETSKRHDRLTLPSLAAGATRRVTLRLSLDETVCPLPYTVTIDAGDEVSECDENNNTATGEACCD